MAGSGPTPFPHGCCPSPTTMLINMSSGSTCRWLSSLQLKGGRDHMVSGSLPGGLGG